MHGPLLQIGNCADVLLPMSTRVLAVHGLSKLVQSVLEFRLDQELLSPRDVSIIGPSPQDFLLRLRCESFVDVELCVAEAWPCWPCAPPCHSDPEPRARATKRGKMGA